MTAEQQAADDPRSKARKRPTTHGDAKAAVTITPEEHAAEKATTAATGDATPAQPYYQGEFMGRPFHQCPRCDMSGITHDFIERHIVAVHVRTDAQRAAASAQHAAASGLIVPGKE